MFFEQRLRLRFVAAEVAECFRVIQSELKRFGVLSKLTSRIAQARWRVARSTANAFAAAPRTDVQITNSPACR